MKFLRKKRKPLSSDVRSAYSLGSLITEVERGFSIVKPKSAIGRVLGLKK
jgi:hypothetical protein